MTNDFYIFASYDSLAGIGFLNEINTPAGYFIDYQFGGGGQIALVIPEPETWALLVLGAAMVIAVRRRG